MAAERPSWLENFRQQAIIESILGIRHVIATFNPTGIQPLNNDRIAATYLLSQGNYQRAFEVATGFAEYFDIHRQGKENRSPNTEIAAVMMGHAAGFNQAAETVTGENYCGEKMTAMQRFDTGLDALSRIANTTMMVVGEVGGRIPTMDLGSTPKVVSPVYRLGPHDFLVVETSVGRQAFFRSRGINSGKPGKWLPVDEIRPADGWLNKDGYAKGTVLENGRRVTNWQLSPEFERISEGLGQMSIPKGQPVPAGKTEIDVQTMNRILDFFGARITPTTVYARPVPE
jgi:hypothetical protein